MITKQELAEALKDRIERDLNQNLAEGWDAVALGRYYFSTDVLVAEIVIERVVGEVLTNILSAHGKMLGNDSLSKFFDGIDPSTTPKDAIEKMLDAAGTAIPIPHSTPLFLDR